MTDLVDEQREAAAEARDPANGRRKRKDWKAITFLVIVPLVFVVDWWSKRWALENLMGNPQELLGGLLPLNLAFNLGAAFGIGFGDDSRWFFIPVTFVALGLIAVLYRDAEQDDHLRLVSLSLIVAGALGNLWDRVRWDQGVVDFFGPVDLGFWNFPIFNVADIAISTGAVLLAISFWQEERRASREDLEASPDPDEVATGA